ncbi:retrovirus-related Pol polyprotein from transposon 17.6 [Trichonephila clavipes]|nr:retrovirus-related Pol polyprotein from transposon 17.6 [Trichonephila clavipes]
MARKRAENREGSLGFPGFVKPVFTIDIKKKDGTTRLYVDYRNRKLVKDRFPLPLIEDVLDRLQGAKVYTTLDLKNGFFHVDVNEDCKRLTSFVVPDGQFEFNKVPFGLSTSPSVFQRYVYSIFRELMRKGVVIIYMDDLIIPAKDEKEGLEKLREVLEVASKYGLEMKFKECQFLRRKVEFLGHVVENGTIRPSIEKTIAIKKFPVPTTVKQVQSFLGLTGYFRKFIPAYSQIAKPLNDLTRKDNPFRFEQPQMEAFEKLKKLLTEKTFDQLRELFIADQIKKSAPYEFQEHFLDEWSTISSPAEIAEKFEEYESVRRTLRPKFYNSFAKGRYEASGSSDTYFQITEYLQGGSNRREKKHFQLNGTSYSRKSKRLTCSYCKGPGHYAVDCTKRPKCSKINTSTDSSIQICSRTSRERIKTRKITMGNKIIEALIDGGSSVSLIREDVSKGIIEPSKLSKDIAVLIGLGKYEVKTKGSFQRKIELDGEQYFLTWHVVPTPNLEFQAIIGSDILEQASVCFYKESVQFRKHEDNNCFLQMKVYETEVEDEIVVQHVTNPQIRRELFELISNYEPKKTETTSVSVHEDCLERRHTGLLICTPLNIF